MTGWDALAVLLVVWTATPLLLGWLVSRRRQQAWDRHASMAQLLTLPPDRCRCGGRERDTSGIRHGAVVCVPLRECHTDGRWGTP